MVKLLSLSFIFIGTLSVACASGTFYLRLNEFENFHGLRMDHMRCDRGQPCDPKFFIKVIGSWGEISKASDCLVDKNHIVFERTIGTTLPNPLSYSMNLVTFPISIDIRVKDCTFDVAGDDIADFYEQLTDLPKPFLFSEPVDTELESDRIRKLELASLPPADLSIKIRVSIWHRCDQNFYGPNCNKFCHAVQPGWHCNASGILVCSSPACSPTKTESSTPMSTTTPLTTSSTRTATSLITFSRLNAASTTSTDVKTTAATKTSPPNSSFNLTDATTEIAPKSFTSIKNQKGSSGESEQSVLQSLSSPLHLLLGIILLLVLLLGIVATAILCARSRKSQRPIIVTGVRYNHDGIGRDQTLGTVTMDHPLSQQDSFSNQAYLTNEQQLMQQAVGYYTRTEQLLQPAVRPDSGVYEEPTDLGERDLPPLPPRVGTVVGATFGTRKNNLNRN